MEFSKRRNRWYCFCNKRIDTCLNNACKEEGVNLGLKVGRSVCEHNRIRSGCKDCGGGSICEHNRQRTRCKNCGGGGICEHNKRRSECKECGSGGICEHNKRRSKCKDCGGGSICEHNKMRHNCKICNPHNYMISLRRSRRWNAINSKNPTHTHEDLCMTSEEWLKYLHKTFEDRYGRPKTEADEVHVDEIIPCSAWNLPDDNMYCWHYLNSQWLLAGDNLSKSNSYEEGDKLAMIEKIQQNFTHIL